MTFRQLTPQQIVELCVHNRLQVIKWSGDLHVPHGDIDTVTQVGRLTRQHELDVAAYGSYYRLPLHAGKDRWTTCVS